MAVNEPTNTPGSDGPTAQAPPDPAAAAALDRATSELARNTDRAPSPELLPAVMQTVWAEFRSGERIALPGSDGTLFITETAASNALVAQVDGLDGLVVRRCTVQAPAAASNATGSDIGTDGEAGSGLGVFLTAAVAYGTDTDALFDQVRSLIVASAHRLFGLAVDLVNIEIVDIYPPRGDAS